MSIPRKRIIAISRDAELASRIRQLFDGKNVRVAWESDIGQLIYYFESDTYDVIVITSMAVRTKAESAIELIAKIRSKSPMTQVLFLVQPKDVRFAMEALQAGTFQYTKLPVSDDELHLLIQTAISRQPQFGQNNLLKDNQQEMHFDQIIGRSMHMQKVYRQMRQAAATNIPILLLGETGTGKDLVAQSIHRASAMHAGPYIPVSLGALPSDLIASELFGHEKGAFTGAVTRHKGKFEQATDGTIFLDEIDSMDEKVQVSLLRMIEEKKFHRLAGQQAIKSNARIIAASNQDLDTLVRNGSFREDLFYRLDVFRIEMPPLSQRYGDIPLLIEKLVAQYNRKLNKNIIAIAPECLDLLENYDWPGNIRELKNVIQRAVLVCEGEKLLPVHLPQRFRRVESNEPVIKFEVGTPLQQVEKEMVLRSLEAAGNNRKRAAELLGISRRAIYNKLRKHNIP